MSGEAEPPLGTVVFAKVREVLCRRQRHVLAIDGFRPAAVAVMLRSQGLDTYVTLTQRSPHLRTHSGQVSLPGGVCDVCDASRSATALRESHEEIGVDPALLDVLGALDDQATPSGYVVTPVVFALRAQPRYVPNPAEVTDVFEVPLTVFANPASAEITGEQVIHHLVYPIRVYHYGSCRITGATARILEDLCKLVELGWPSDGPRARASSRE